MFGERLRWAGRVVERRAHWSIPHEFVE